MAHWNVNSASQVLLLLFDSSIRAILLAALCWAVVWIVRIRSACTVHAIWTAMLAGMILMPVLRTALPRLPVVVLPAAAASLNTAPPPAPAELSQVRENPKNAGDVGVQVKAVQRSWPRWALLTLMVYALVALALLVLRAAGYYFTWKLIRGSRQIPPNEMRVLPGETSSERQLRLSVRESDQVHVPVTAGFLCPAIILPPDWRNWECHKLRAVLAHEFAHVRRHDFFIRNLSALNKCLYWFHPLAWWLDMHLAKLAEQVSDDCALDTADRHEYADLLLSFAARVHTAGGRVRWQGLAMAGRTSMSQRIERILSARPASSLRLTQLAVALLFVLGPLVTVSLAVVEPTARAISRISPITPAATRLNNVTLSSLAGIWLGELGPIRISVHLKQYRGNLTGKVLSWVVESPPKREFRLDLNQVPPPPPAASSTASAGRQSPASAAPRQYSYVRG